MSKSKSRDLLLTLTIMTAGLSITSLLQLLQTAHSQTDYEEYLIVETDTAQELKQKNVGSGESTNINCGTNTAGTNLAQPITCPDIDGDNSGVLQRPVVTQRAAPTFTTSTVSSSIPENFAVSRAICNDDEVVTGGGFEFSTSQGTTFREHIIMERAEGNTWSVYVNEEGMTFRAYAECLKLVPSG